MTPSTLVRQWLAPFLATGNDAASRAPTLTPEQAREAFELASRLAILPTIADALTAQNAWRVLPPDVADQWQTSALQTTLHNAVLLRDAEQLQATLKAAGIQCLFIKGTALLCSVHQQPGARHLDDIDVVVDRPRHAIEVLTAEGYQRAERFDGMALDGRTLAEWNRAEHHAEGGLLSPNGTPVDLHRRIPGVAVSQEPGYWSRAEREPRRGITVPSLRDQFEIVAAHIVVHHLSSPRYWARHVADVAAIRAKAPGLVADSTAARVSCTVADAVQALHPRALQLVFPSQRVAETGDQLLHAVEVAQRWRADVLLHPERIRHKLLPAPKYMRYRYGEEAAGRRLAYLYARRLLSGDFFEETA